MKSFKNTAIKFGASALFLAASLGTQVAYAVPVDLITNGGFEAGNFSGWTAVNNGVSGGCGTNNWEVNSTGHQGCTGNGTTTAAPISGSFAAFNTFDGGAANYTLSQSFVLPESILSATLSFMDELHMGMSGTLRTFRVDLYDATNTNLLFNFYLEQPSGFENQAWTTHSLDVSAALIAEAGQTVTLRFTNVIPQAFTGPAGFGLDSISLDTTVPEPTTIALLGLGLFGFAAARRRKQ
jgi:hypothetical protein